MNYSTATPQQQQAERDYIKKTDRALYNLIGYTIRYMDAELLEYNRKAKELKIL
jgi:hypothetical protein